MSMRFQFVKSRFFVGILCFVVCVAVALVVLPRQYKKQEATTTVIRAAEAIVEGTVITQAMLSADTVGAYGLPDGIYASADEVIGMVASSTIYADEMIRPNRLMTEEAYLAQQMETTVELLPDQSLVSVELPSTAAGLAGLLRSGDYVTVYEVVEKQIESEDGRSGNETYMETKIALNSMRVYEVRNTELESMDALDKQQIAALEAQTGAEFDFDPVYIVFCCTEAEAMELVRLNAEGTLHLGLEQEVA
ncbi:MAG: flagella basal body P-ring formation protein FlgA [Oscillospiraceae bacterium]|nr:flagella basal body P-ring formation protein FlgA [Oscillospiraceae bacterium]